MSRRTLGFLRIAFILTVAIGDIGLAGQEPTGSEFLAEVTRTFGQADDLNAELLSPQHYSKARKHFADAQNRLDRKQSPKSIEKDAEKALNELKLAIQAAELAQVALKDLLTARSETLDSGFSLERSKDFKQAEKKFQEAVKKVEKQDTKGARNPSREAAKGYRKAVLQSLEKDLLAGAEKQLKSSRKMIPKQAYQEANRALKDLRSDLKTKGKGDFPVAATVTSIRDGITQALSDAGIGSG